MGGQRLAGRGEIWYNDPREEVISTEDIREDWDRSAEEYDLFNDAPDSYSRLIEWPCIQGLLPDLRGKSVLDIGCGTGIFTFLLEGQGPSRILGVDLSEGMLALARKKARARGSRAEFIQGDAVEALGRMNQRFDLAFSSTTSHYIADLPALFAGIAGCLAPEGACVLSAIHPVYSAQYPVAHGETFPRDEEWTVRYLDRRDRAYIQPWIEYNDRCKDRLSRSYHHTFGDYVHAITGAGLRLARVEEPAPPEIWRETMPGRYENYLETPTYMILKMERAN